MNSKKSKKRGRPRIPKQERHARIVPIRFTDEDLRSFQRSARAANQTLSEWVRGKLRSAVPE